MSRLRRAFRVIRAAAAAAVALALFQHGPAVAQGADALRNRINQGTIGIISGGVNGTYIRIAADLAAVLDRGDELRILPILGKGSVQNITDLLYLRGVDIAIVQSDVLGYIRDQNFHPNIEQRIRYVTKLYNEEVHVLAGIDVRTLSDLAGKKVNVDNTGSGTFITASTIFKLLAISVEPTTFDQALALEKLRAGEIAAMIYVAGKPTELFKRLPEGSKLHFVPIPPTEELLATYLPSQFDHRDYPNLIAEGASQPTLAVGAVMASYNWKSDSDRYRRLDLFVRSFFDSFDAFLKPPRHPKWQEVNLAATVPGWTRFVPAETWIAQRPRPGQAAAERELRDKFERFLAFMQQAGQLPRNRPISETERAALFDRFVEWQQANPD